MLDIGCASGEFACQLSSASRKITGIDLDPFMIEEAKDIGFVNTHIFGGYDGKECEKSDFFHLVELEK
ncbi:MAG: class I SAM-dependent methyltransferase [Spirochaetales bacterium]|nr:class I SAM-dependent methyltransferase [Spirochaetales bacterium]